MLNKLLKIFSKTTTTTDLNTSESNNTLTLSVENLEPYLKIIITQTDNTSAKTFANMLYDLHKGHFIAAITKTLINIGKNANNTDVNKFVQNVIVEWKYLCDKDSIKKSDDEPQIKPTHFFQFLKSDTNE